MPEIEVNIQTAGWAQVLDPKYRYIFIKGGRMSGKSHEVASYLCERSVCEKNLKIVCLREIQKSIKRSSKSIIDDKIKAFGADQFYKSIDSEIRKTIKGDDGMFYFQGMNDLTADNIKSLEGFSVGWFEEAQNCTAKSLKTLRPTIMRMDGAQLIFTWNPKFPDDPIETFCSEMKGEDDCLVVHVNYDMNPFLPKLALEEIARDKVKFKDDFDHIYLGQFDTSFHGHYYAKNIQQAEDEGRISDVPRKAGVDVITAWDLGRSDATAIWVAQVCGLQVRVIDYMEDQFQDLDHYVDWIKARGYNGPNDMHWLPFDSNHERLGMKGSIKQQVKDMGLLNVNAPLAAASKEAGRRLVKSLIREAYFDKNNCRVGINVLKRECSIFDERTGTFKEQHEQDGAAAFRYLADVLNSEVKSRGIVHNSENDPFKISRAGGWMAS